MCVCARARVCVKGLIVPCVVVAKVSVYISLDDLFYTLNPTSSCSLVPTVIRLQRAKERKHYTDMDIDEDDIDGKRNYNIEEKLLRNNFTGDFVQEMKGHGEIEERCH